MVVTKPTSYRAAPPAVVNITAGATIAIPASADVVRIVSDGGSSANALTLPSVHEGKLLAIYNDDEHPTSGALIIPAGKAVSLRFLNGSWVELGVSRTT